MIIELSKDLARGDAARVSHLSLSAHAGTHVDAPRHLDDRAAGIESIAPATLVGPCAVVMAAAPLIGRAEVAALPRRLPPRVLFKGRAPLTPGAARALALRRVVLVGTDALSIDPIEDESLPAHRILLASGIAILEGLDLSLAEPGWYRLVALPLLIPGADGAPARALLEPWPGGRTGRPARRAPPGRGSRARP